MLTFAAITFLWPRLLWLLLALPLLVALYLALVWRRRRSAATHLHLETVGPGAAQARAAGRLRRTLPAVLWLLALAALLLAIARPQAALILPARVEAVMLALDMSGSMRATDIEPNRLAAAQSAAKLFVDAQPASVKVGVVAVAAAAAVVQSPTDNRESIAQAIDRLEPQRGTALGSGLIIALDTLLPEARIDVEQFINPRPGGSAADAAKAGEAKRAPSPPGSNASAAIVLLSDGQSNVGPDPIKAAEVAADYGVRVYTVGIGTAEGATVKSDGITMRVRLDDETLKKVAAITDGEYFRASDATELKKIYRNLGARLAFEKQTPTEVTALLAGLGAWLAMLAAALSLLWFNRIL